MNPEAGMTLGSRYTLTDRIAAGGMGDVWRAKDSVLGRDVAVKVMRASAAEDPTFANRFRDEARHSAGMSHQNIATVYDYGEDDGTAYLVMELVDGEPLSQMIARGPMNPDQVRGIVGQAALALAAAHAAGVVHRDVKPANILITPDGRVKLTDFGIARAVDGASHTRTGEVLGTPQYLSPEQALGKGATGASDLYALGIITQEMLTGRKPFDSGSAVATALAQVNDPPPPLPDWVPSDLRRIVDQSLAKDPADRPTSAAAVAAALGMPVTGLAQIPPATSVVHTGDTDPDGTQVMDAPTGTEVLGAAAVGGAVAYAAGGDEPAGYDPGYEDGVPPLRAVPAEPGAGEAEQRDRSLVDPDHRAAGRHRVLRVGVREQQQQPHVDRDDGDPDPDALVDRHLDLRPADDDHAVAHDHDHSEHHVDDASGRHQQERLRRQVVRRGEGHPRGRRLEGQPDQAGDEAGQGGRRHRHGRQADREG